MLQERKHEISSLKRQLEEFQESAEPVRALAAVNMREREGDAGGVATLERPNWGNDWSTSTIPRCQPRTVMGTMRVPLFSPLTDTLSCACMYPGGIDELPSNCAVSVGQTELCSTESAYAAGSRKGAARLNSRNMVASRLAYCRLCMVETACAEDCRHSGKAGKRLSEPLHLCDER